MTKPSWCNEDKEYVKVYSFKDWMQSLEESRTYQLLMWLITGLAAAVELNLILTGVLVVHVFMGNGTLVEGHQLLYNDCSSPTDIIRLDALEACNQKQRQLDMTKYQSYILLQRVGELETGGWHCYMEVSDFLLFCGAFSHMKMLKTPTVDKPTPVTQAQCREWVTSERFVPPGSLETGCWTSLVLQLSQ